MLCKKPVGCRKLSGVQGEVLKWKKKKAIHKRKQTSTYSYQCEKWDSKFNLQGQKESGMTA